MGHKIPEALDRGPSTQWINIKKVVIPVREDMKDSHLLKDFFNPRLLA